MATSATPRPPVGRARRRRRLRARACRAGRGRAAVPSARSPQRSAPTASGRWCSSGSGAVGRRRAPGRRVGRVCRAGRHHLRPRGRRRRRGRRSSRSWCRPWSQSAPVTGGLLPSVGSLRRLAGLAPGRPAGLRRTRDGGGRRPSAGGRAVARRTARRGRARRCSPVPSSASPTRPARLLADVGRWPYARVRPGEGQDGPGTELATVDALAEWAASATGPCPGPGRCQRLLRPRRPSTAGPPSTGFGLLCIEQPFARDDLDGHRRLAARSPPRSAWTRASTAPRRVVEAVTSRAPARWCASSRPASGASAPRSTWSTGARATACPWWIGGMFESGLRPRRHTARWPPCPARRCPVTWRRPPRIWPTTWSAPVPRRIDPATGRLAVPVPTGPGLGPAPDAGGRRDRWVRGVAIGGPRPLRLIRSRRQRVGFLGFPVGRAGPACVQLPSHAPDHHRATPERRPPAAGARPERAGRPRRAARGGQRDGRRHPPAGPRGRDPGGRQGARRGQPAGHRPCCGPARRWSSRSPTWSDARTTCSSGSWSDPVEVRRRAVWGPDRAAAGSARPYRPAAARPRASAASRCNNPVPRQEHPSPWQGAQTP